ncbi:MAG: Tad domain-containing protein [Woeseiaceae bacterium]|nr:Tad domain-containing protein [Woeseiaceae bacterium]
MNTIRLHSKQRGAIVPIVVIGLLAMLAVAGLAMDGSHALANKTRAQNTVDASALAAAKVLDDTDGDTALATAAANSLFSINADAAGNHELNSAYDAGDITVTVQYSATLNPFVPGSFVPGTTSWFVRVIATGFDTETTLTKVLGVNEIATPATAVAGPSGPIGVGGGATVCDIAPIAVCEDDVPGTVDTEALRVLKPNPGVHGDVGPGNYKMLRLDCSGGDCLRRNLAGDYDQCVEVGNDEVPVPPVETEPGVSSGPTSQGFNTRFNVYQGGGMNSTDYPPDYYVSEQDTGPNSEYLRACEDPNDPLAEHIFLTSNQGSQYCKDFGENPGFDPTNSATWGGEWSADHVTQANEINYDYADYGGAAPGGPDDPGSDPRELGRRILNFPVVDCAGDQNGQSTLEVSGFACFFMLQSLEGGQSAGAGHIFGQYIGDCLVNGNAGTNPGGGPSGPLLYKIQLYRNPDSKDS